MNKHRNQENRWGPGPATSARPTVGALAGTTLLMQADRILGANDRVRVAVVGLRGQGFVHVEEYAQLPNVEIAAVCDVDENILNQRLADMAKMGLPKPISFIDVRKLLEDNSIDAISIATPNHWHALITIWACQAGKDVYVEKPCSHNLWEGRQMVRAAAKYNRLVQHGTNMRSAPAVREGIQKLREGLVGDVYMARGICYCRRPSIGRALPETVPPGVHYDLWTGPAPLKPFTRNRFHYNFHWIWDTGNGDVANQGIHYMDVARWGLGVTFPNKVSAIGGHLMFDDDQETPNTLNCSFQFDMPDGKRKLLIMEVRHWITNHEADIDTPGFGLLIPGFRGYPDSGEEHRRQFSGQTVGDIYYGSKGYMAIAHGGMYEFYRTWLGQGQELGPEAYEYAGSCWGNFIDAVRTRNRTALHTSIEEGHASCALSHLANASYRLGRTLNFDPATEQVIGDEEANRLLHGTYRDPFVVPETV